MSIFDDINALYIKVVELERRLKELEKMVTEEISKIKDEIDYIKYGGELN
jgi:hypothetical protein